MRRFSLLVLLAVLAGTTAADASTVVSTCSDSAVVYKADLPVSVPGVLHGGRLYCDSIDTPGFHEGSTKCIDLSGCKLRAVANLDMVTGSVDITTAVVYDYSSGSWKSAEFAYCTANGTGGCVATTATVTVSYGDLPRVYCSSREGSEGQSQYGINVALACTLERV